MSLREQIGESVRKEKEFKLPFPVRAYYKHFDGYSEMTVKDGGGRKRIKRVYTKPYYYQNISKTKCILLKIAYPILLVIAVVIFTSNTVSPYAANLQWYSAALQALNVAAFFWVLIALCSYIFAKRKMTGSEYKSSSIGLKKASLTSAVCLVGQAVSVLLYMTLNAQSGAAFPATNFVGYIAASLSMLAMRLLECRIEYKVLDNNKLPLKEVAEIKC